MIYREFISFILLCTILRVHSIMWYLEPNTHKCLKEELQAKALISGEFEVSEAPGQKVDYVVRDSKGHILSQKEDISKGKFSFSTENFDTFEICFMSRVPSHQRGVRQEVSLVTKHGAEARNYEGGNVDFYVKINRILNFKNPFQIGEVAKLKPMEVELKKLEDLSDDIVQDFSLMRKREEEMRDTNESTNNRVLYFSIFSMCCLLGLATWQVLYLRRFFKAKKLIE